MKKIYTNIADILGIISLSLSQQANRAAPMPSTMGLKGEWNTALALLYTASQPWHS